jgi:hypothetical protein
MFDFLHTRFVYGPIYGKNISPSFKIRFVFVLMYWRTDVLMFVNVAESCVGDDPAGSLTARAILRDVKHHAIYV